MTEEKTTLRLAFWIDGFDVHTDIVDGLERWQVYYGKTRSASMPHNWYRLLSVWGKLNDFFKYDWSFGVVVKDTDEALLDLYYKPKDVGGDYFDDRIKELLRPDKELVLCGGFNHDWEEPNEYKASNPEHTHVWEAKFWATDEPWNMFGPDVFTNLQTGENIANFPIL